MIQVVNTFFVYGTLKRGGRLHDYIKHCPFLGYAGVVGHTLIDLTDGAYPCMVKSSSDKDGVMGELYMVDADTKSVLDHIEHGYTLTAVDAWLYDTSDRPLQALTYLWTRNSLDKAYTPGFVSWVPPLRDWGM